MLVKRAKSLESVIARLRRRLHRVLRYARQLAPRWNLGKAGESAPSLGSGKLGWAIGTPQRPCLHRPPAFGRFLGVFTIPCRLDIWRVWRGVWRSIVCNLTSCRSDVFGRPLGGGFFGILLIQKFCETWRYVEVDHYGFLALPRPLRFLSI